jgi:hypothetical protein
MTGVTNIRPKLKSGHDKKPTEAKTKDQKKALEDATLQDYPALCAAALVLAHKHNASSFHRRAKPLLASGLALSPA